MYLEMLSKDNVVTWFKELTSFKRIDIMCNLLQFCQPFETRFLGTCIEELGRKDFTLLRQFENIVNNPSELNSQDLNNINNKETRTQISKFLCVLHSTNKRCANELYNVILNFCDDINNIIKSGALLNDDSPLDEILLIYALGIFHPAFSFDKKIYLGDFLTRLRGEEERIKLFKQKQEIINAENSYSDNLSMSQTSEPMQNSLLLEEPVINIPSLSYPSPIMSSVISPQISQVSSPSGSPPIRSKVPKIPTTVPPLIEQNRGGQSPSQLKLTPVSSDGEPSNNMAVLPVSVKELRLLTNGQATDEMNIIRQNNTCTEAILVQNNTCPCTECIQRGMIAQSTSPRLPLKQDPPIDQMRDLRLNIEESNYNAQSTNSSTDSNSDPSPPTTPSDGRNVSQPYIRGRGFNNQYRRRTEMNGHDPSLSTPSSTTTPGTDSNSFYPQQQQQPPQYFHPPPYSTIPVFPPYFPDLIYPQQYPPLLPHMAGPVFASPATIQQQQPRISSCYNCGSQTHIAMACPDPTIDEVSKQGQYRLDYEGPPLNSIGDN